MAMRIDEGHFGDVRLDGVVFLGTFAWPKAIHEGNGEAQMVVHENAAKEQIDALFTILSGAETEPGATIFNVFSDVIETHHSPLFKPIEFEVDIEKRRGRYAVDGFIETVNSPITNPVTGEEHRAQVTLPDGFEYTTAEYASSTTKGTGEVSLEWTNGHGHFSMLHLTQTGPVR